MYMANNFIDGKFWDKMKELYGNSSQEIKAAVLNEFIQKAKIALGME